MSRSTLIAGISLGVVLAAMVVEAAISSRHERALRARGAVEPQNDVYRLMRMAYPLSFVAMTVEGGLFGVAEAIGWSAGGALFLAAKALKYWAMASLGVRWTFRVLVPADLPLVDHGPYRWVAHPNYLAVIGELCGTALMMAAPFTGIAAIAGFGALIAQRIAIENRALGRLP